MMPIVAQIKELLENQAEVHQFDIDKNQELADELKVQSIPTFILYKNGKEIWRQSGEMEAETLLGKIKSAL